MKRFLRYNAVGAMGLTVKFSVLTGLVELAGLGHLWATAAAVEAALLHNFLWHLRWTWRDRSAGLSRRAALGRLVKFHLATGSAALAANLILMRLLVDGAGIHYVLANAAATVFAGLVNFTISHWLVFVPADRPASCRM